MLVILNNSSFQLAKCMLNFRDAGIKKCQTTYEKLASINSNEKNIILAMISIFQIEEFGP